MIFLTLLGCQAEKPEPPHVEKPKEATEVTPSNQDSPPPSDQVLYIQSSTANLRGAASTQSNVLIGLPIGTKGKVRKKDGEWVYFQAEGKIGWVHSSLLTETKPTLDYALSQYQSASRSDKRKWIERAAALAPKNKEVITMLIEELDYQGDHEAMRRAELGLRALNKKDSIYFSNKSFQDGAPEHYLRVYPSTLSCREEIKTLALQGAEPPSEQMLKKWSSWYREVPKDDFWPVLQQNCFEFYPEKTVWSLIAKDGLGTWKSIELLPKLTVRSYIEEPCVGDRNPPPSGQVTLSWRIDEEEQPALFFSTLNAPKTTPFPFLPLQPQESKAVPNLAHKDGHQIHRRILTDAQKDFGIASVYLEEEIGDGHFEDGADPNSVLVSSLVVEWISGKRSILHRAVGKGKYSYHPPEIKDIVLTDLNQDGAPDFLLREEDIGYVLMETNNEALKSIQTIERSMPLPIGGC